MQPAIGQKQLRWLALIALLILVSGVAVYLLNMQGAEKPQTEAEARQALMAQRRTYATSLVAEHQPRPVQPGIVDRLRLLPGLDALGQDGIRLLAFTPGRTYAVAIRHRVPLAAKATGMMIVVERHDGREVMLHRPFVMPADQYRSVMAEVDRLTDGWPGSIDAGVTYYPAAFERVRGGRITSGYGAGGHYDQLQETVLGLVTLYASVPYRASPAHEPEPFP